MVVVVGREGNFAERGVHNVHVVEREEHSRRKLDFRRNPDVPRKKDCQVPEVGKTRSLLGHCGG